MGCCDRHYKSRAQRAHELGVFRCVFPRREVPCDGERRQHCSELPFSPAHEYELCSIINAVLRADDVAAMTPCVVLVRALNRLCVARKRTDGTIVRFPPGGHCWRGGGFDDRHKDFFTIGRMYRVPGFLATSFSERVTTEFIYRAVHVGGRSGILWHVVVDLRGETDFAHKCKQSNFIQHTHVAGEAEYLFAPYSAFTVREVVWSSAPDDRTPHRITIEALTDNRDAPAGLPLAPWF